ncbi:helix-turn-helix domain-containing protein [Mucilaginibacter sp. PAMB04168]|uniref:helix-turn-helix domain-containing protein n=1 Tax=Mucilaginibacter sp. PAMB04168 TaxID=3138567 RepID=UPI0031F6397A
MKTLTFEQLPQAIAQLIENFDDLKALLSKQEATTIKDEDKLLSVKEAANLLNLSTSTIYGLVNRKQIPVSKRGKRLYFSKFELVNWIKEGRKLTQQELDNAANAFIANLKKRG